MDTALVNRVANSGLITFNLEDYYPTTTFAIFDIKDYLFQGLILKEKDFREALKEHDWSKFEHTTLLLYCSTDAIIPVWAYMLVSSYATAFAKEIFIGDKEAYLNQYYRTLIHGMDVSSYEGAKMIVKGCSHKPVPASAYSEILVKLQPIAASIMYGEPCSTVPIYKKR
ncbi:MAG: DUF2480 family protein [Saprospiraceae bacterium]|nr:DUF2480 family protein [Saprospiraceae bacterium]